MTGTRGPIPKRSDQRRRRNIGDPITKAAPLATPIEQPPLTFPAHSLAAEWYASLAESGQAAYFEPSDWAAAQVVAFDLTRHLNSRRVSAQMLAAVWTAMGDLLTTEAARRRVRMEIDRSGNAEASEAERARVARLDDYRRAVGSLS